MHALPFADIDEAQGTAHGLLESLHYFSVGFGGSGSERPLSLQQTYELMSRALGCNGWSDLGARLRSAHLVEYYAAEMWKNDLPQHVELAKRMATLLGSVGDESALERLRQVLSRCAFGCSPRVRESIRVLIGPTVGCTARQWAEVTQVDVWYDYHSRYLAQQGASALRQARDKAYARILGEGLPRRPARRKEESR